MKETARTCLFTPTEKQRQTSVPLRSTNSLTLPSTRPRPYERTLTCSEPASDLQTSRQPRHHVLPYYYTTIYLLSVMTRPGPSCSRILPTKIVIRPADPESARRPWVPSSGLLWGGSRSSSKLEPPADCNSLRVLFLTTGWGLDIQSTTPQSTQLRRRILKCLCRASGRRRDRTLGRTDASARRFGDAMHPCPNCEE